MLDHYNNSMIYSYELLKSLDTKIEHFYTHLMNLSYKLEVHLKPEDKILMNKKKKTLKDILIE